MSGFEKQAARLQNWCQNNALPFWATAAKDGIRGGYHEQLFLDGTADKDHTRRVRVQARHAYVYAHAAALGWYGDARCASDHAWDYVTGPGSVGRPFPDRAYQGCAHLLAADGTVIDPQRDSYAQAFVILAGAWRYQAFKDRISLAIAYETLAFLDAHVRADNGGWSEGLEPSLPRRQNPHMHLFEALMALYDASGDEALMRRASDIYNLFNNHFFDSNKGLVIEFFNADWSPAGGTGGPIEPGHMMEWCWLLRAYEDRTGVDVSTAADALYTAGETLGYNSDLGLLCDSVDMQKGVRSDGHRTWPQTEYLKASLAQARAGRSGMRARSAQIIDAIFENYLSRGKGGETGGGWIDSVSAKGEILTPTMPTSTFYHIMCAAAETRVEMASPYIKPKRAFEIIPARLSYR